MSAIAGAALVAAVLVAEVDRVPDGAALEAAIAEHGELLAWIGTEAPAIRLALAEHIENRRTKLAGASEGERG